MASGLQDKWRDRVRRPTSLSLGSDGRQPTLSDGHLSEQISNAIEARGVTVDVVYRGPSDREGLVAKDGEIGCIDGVANACDLGALT